MVKYGTHFSSNFQSKIHDIISETKSTQHNGHAEFPWMIDGAGLPPNAKELLPRMVLTHSKHSYIYFTIIIQINIL